MRRFFQPSLPGPDGSLLLVGAEAHHAAKVIRLRTGESAVVLNGKGIEYLCTTVDVDRKRVVLQIDEEKIHPQPRGRVKIVQAVTKGKSFDFILQKSVELGAAEIVPLLTERVVAKPDQRDFDDKLEKWNQVAIEAIKQCGTAWLPEISRPQTLGEAAAGDAAMELRLVAALMPEARHPRLCFENFHDHHQRMPESVSVWIGPEGDFSEVEYRTLIDAGVLPVNFGDRVLRSETAAVFALSILGYELSAPR
jgi:16S rRNA (uracil1498-N3)-methyltransferase